LQPGVENLLAWLGIEPTTFDHNSQLGVFDLSALATRTKCLHFLNLSAILIFCAHIIEGKYLFVDLQLRF